MLPRYLEISPASQERDSSKLEAWLRLGGALSPAPPASWRDSRPTQQAEDLKAKAHADEASATGRCVLRGYARTSWAKVRAASALSHATAPPARRLLWLEPAVFTLCALHVLDAVSQNAGLSRSTCHSTVLQQQRNGMSWMGRLPMGGRRSRAAIHAGASACTIATVLSLD